MSALNAVELLALWDRAQAVPPTRRPLALLAPLTEIDGLGGLPVGVCDARLLRLRERLFGPQLEARVDCPQCRESLEFTLPVGALCPAEPAEPGDPTGGLRCAHAGWSAEFHAPRHRDLEAVAEAPDPGAAREALLERCLESLRAPDGSARTLAEAPAELVAAVVAGFLGNGQQGVHRQHWHAGAKCQSLGDRAGRAQPRERTRPGAERDRIEFTQCQACLGEQGLCRRNQRR